MSSVNVGTCSAKRRLQIDCIIKSHKRNRITVFFFLFLHIFPLSTVQSTTTYVRKALARRKEQQMVLSPGPHVQYNDRWPPVLGSSLKTSFSLCIMFYILELSVKLAKAALSSC